MAGQNFIYDAQGQRVMKDQVGATTWDKMYWHGLGGEVLMESDFSGGNQVEHIYFNGQRIAKREANGTVYYFFDDHLGNTRVTTTASGTVVDEFDPYPHGWFRTISFASGDWHLFTDHEYDPDTGLHFMRARHYSPSAGRFLQPDTPLVDQYPQDPQSWNLYAYVRNNPLSHVDKTGRDCRTIGTYTYCSERSEFQSLNDAEDAHEARHRKDNTSPEWIPGWKKEQRGFAAEAPVLEERLKELETKEKTKEGLTETEKREKAAVISRLETVKDITIGPEANRNAKRYYRDNQPWFIRWLIPSPDADNVPRPKPSPSQQEPNDKGKKKDCEGCDGPPKPEPDQKKEQKRR